MDLEQENQAWYDLAIVASPSNENEIHIGGVLCWRSYNKGKRLGQDL